MKNSESTQITIRRDFAQNLKHYLSEKGMTQLELSRKVNVAPASVSDWVRAKAMPRAQTLQRMAELFDCPAAELLTVKRPLADDQQDDKFILRRPAPRVKSADGRRCVVRVDPEDYAVLDGLARAAGLTMKRVLHEMVVYCSSRCVIEG